MLKVLCGNIALSSFRTFQSPLKLSSKYMYQTFIANMSGISSVHRAQANTLDYRVYFKDEKGPISPWHDIPLYHDEAQNIFNMVVEIPRWSNAKLEIATKDKLNPIKQDTKKGKLRFVDNCFPHHGYIWNYGALPQTWEDPNHKDEDTGSKGDNDPIDVCEIGSNVQEIGAVIQVKVLGTLALIDEGETDWKLIAIDVNDPLADTLNDIEDVEKTMPGFLRATHEWFRIYKIPAGKPENKFAFGGQYKNKEYALKVVSETHEFWKKLIANPADMETTNTSVESSAAKISVEDAEAIVTSNAEPGPAEPIPQNVNKWHFVSV